MTPQGPKTASKTSSVLARSPAQPSLRCGKRAFSRSSPFRFQRDCFPAHRPIRSQRHRSLCSRCLPSLPRHRSACGSRAAHLVDRHRGDDTVIRARVARVVAEEVSHDVHQSQRFQIALKGESLSPCHQTLFAEYQVQVKRQPKLQCLLFEPGQALLPNYFQAVARCVHLDPAVSPHLDYRDRNLPLADCQVPRSRQAHVAELHGTRRQSMLTIHCLLTFIVAHTCSHQSLRNSVSKANSPRQ